MIQRLAEGGMADVLLARTRGIEGFERHVVIKRIRAEQARDLRYVSMFLDEARLAASLHHHNVVQVNDIGEDDGEYFFAMEYVHGEDARRLLSEVSRNKARVPLEHVITIVTATAAGLHHAHEQRLPDRTPLGIVHRDVSPANILIGYDGGVKVVDFGIAKAAHRTEETQSGVVKGKVAYMSPEQCNCEPVDRRSDVFSLGIVLYELVTMVPLFHCGNDYLSMSSIVNGRMHPPSHHCPEIAVELEAIIMKALATAPEDRFASADDMRLALEHFAETAGLRTSTTALADYMKSLFGERPEPWLARDDADDPEIEIDEVSPTGERFALPLPAPLPEPITSSGDVVVAAQTVKSSPRIARQPFPRPVTARPRNLWVAAMLIAVIAGGASLVLVAHEATTERVVDARESVPPPAEIAPMLPSPPPPPPPPAITPEPAVELTVLASPVPETVRKKPVRRVAKPRPTRKPAPITKHWDPSTLFPE